MQKLYLDTRNNDAKVREDFLLTEDIMMENAAAALESKVWEHCFNECGHYLERPAVLILCGTGNNGGDGYALSRRLMGKKLSVTVCSFGEPKTPAAQLQKKRAEKAGIQFIDYMEVDGYIESKSFDFKVAVDCVFGSGFHGELPMEVDAVFEEINALNDVYRIACDIPSGFKFRAHETVTMGALKECLYEDKAKDFCGKISVADLGVTRTNFENAGKSSAWLLEKNDMELPYRTRLNVNKGNFGHVAVYSGEKNGAAVIAGSSGLRFGAGLVTLVCSKENAAANVPYELMTSDEVPAGTTAIAFGMGAGRNRGDVLVSMAQKAKEIKAALVLDADAFYMQELATVLDERSSNKLSTVLTPHPKEFSSLLELCGLGKFSVEEIQQNRFEKARLFCQKYPDVVLLLKGANVIVAQRYSSKQDCDVYVNPFGGPELSKAGSGDVLAGLVAALVAQKKNPAEAAATATLAHSLAAGSIKNNFALTPVELITAVSAL